MPVLLKKIEAFILDTYQTDLDFYTTLSGEIQFEDYIELNGFIAYLQNFTQVQTLIDLQKPLNYGLKNQYNQKRVTLFISY